MVSKSARLSASLLACASVLSLCASHAFAAEADAPARRTSVIEGDVDQVVIIAPRNEAASVAPVKSS